VTQPFRLQVGGVIDRSRLLGFRFDGREYEGHPGDTLASALLANGVRVVARSFKYHRPRGIFAAGAEEPSALVRLETGGQAEPNRRPGEIVLFDGLRASSQHAWPSLAADFGALAGRVAPLLPAGFYYKTFIAPRALWAPVWEPLLRRMAGLGRAPAEPDPVRYDKRHAHCDVLVVGGGPAGAAAAIYAARKGIRTGIAAERFGGQVLDTMGIENFISVSHTEGPKLAASLEGHVRDYEVDVMNLQTAVELVPAGEAGGLHEVKLASGASLRGRTVILSPGARWRQMGVPGEDEYRNKGVAYCPHCDGPLFKGKRVAVIGGGNSGVEAAIDLAGIVAHVTLIEFDPALRADAVLQAKLRSLPNVAVVTSALTTEVLGDGQKVTGLVYTDRENGGSHDVELEGIFVQIGLVPNSEWLKGSVALSPRGEIEVDARGSTSVPGVFAAGDATTVPFKQIVIAMGEGAKASLSAFDYLIRH